jgi:F-type H+-transporting ATPase subunit delta
MTRASLSKRYATALAKCVEDDEIEAVAGELVGLTELFSTHPTVVQFASNKAVDRETRRRFLESILERVDLMPVTRRFMLVLAERERVDLLEQISASFGGLVDNRLNRAEAVVTTAVPLGDEQRERLQSRLSELTGKTIRLREREDPAIIGGVVVQLGTRAIDGSVKSSLSRMREELVAEA